MCLAFIVSGCERPKGDLIAKSVSPDGRWKITVYTINPGAMASQIYYAKVKDTKSRRKAKRINLSGPQLNGSAIRWEDSHIASILGEIVDVRTGASQLVGTSTSPNGQWQVNVYFIYQESSSRNTYYAQILDRKKHVLIDHDVELQASQLIRDSINWKNANIIDIYGEAIDVRSGAPSNLEGVN